MLRKKLYIIKNKIYKKIFKPKAKRSPQKPKILEEMIIVNGLTNYFNFTYESQRIKTLNYVESLKIRSFEYKYCESCKNPNLYSSVYALLIKLMYHDLKDGEMKSWGEYLDSFQGVDGLFYDDRIRNEHFDNSDWWGARHLNLHIINAYAALKLKPKYQFNFLEKYYDLKYTESWLNSFDWSAAFSHENDLDNKIMNIVCAMQFQRDTFDDNRAGQAVKFIQEYLSNKLNKRTSLWGVYNLLDPHEFSRMVQFGYHILPIYTYDGIYNVVEAEKIVNHALKTQNKYGGFGVTFNSSACEDIDSLDLLIRFGNSSKNKNLEIETALKRAFIFILSNENEDGGFVFRRDQEFWYGHEEMKSGYNESAMFPTWFRTLSIAYVVNALNIKNDFNLARSPGFSI
jgi:hypothetical protein